MKDISWAYAALKSSLSHEYYTSENAAILACDSMNAIAKRLVIPEHWWIETNELGFWIKLKS